MNQERGLQGKNPAEAAPGSPKPRKQIKSSTGSTFGKGVGIAALPTLSCDCLAIFRVLEPLLWGASSFISRGRVAIMSP